MILFDYIFYLAYTFLIGRRNSDKSGVYQRARNGVSIICFSFLMNICLFIYSLSMNFNLLKYDKNLIYLFGGVIAVTTNLFFYFRYKKSNYYLIVEKYRKKFNYNFYKAKVYFMFILVFTIFLFWISMILIRKFIL